MRSLGSTVLILLLPALALAQGSVAWTTNHYSVTGSTFSDIRASIERSRPSQLGRMDGLTAWRIEWRFATEPAANGCRCSSFSPRTSIAVTLPRWVAPSNTAPMIIQAWTRYITALGQHEAGHGQLALAAAAEMQKRALETPETADCRAMNERINALARGIVDDYRRRDQEYDERTRHGETQGAVLPGGRRRPGP